MDENHQIKDLGEQDIDTVSKYLPQTIVRSG